MARTCVSLEGQILGVNGIVRPMIVTLARDLAEELSGELFLRVVTAILARAALACHQPDEVGKEFCGTPKDPVRDAALRSDNH